MLFGLFERAHTFSPKGQLYVVKVIYQSSDVMLSKQMTDPPLPLPLELHYLQYPCLWFGPFVKLNFILKILLYSNSMLKIGIELNLSFHEQQGPINISHRLIPLSIRKTECLHRGHTRARLDARVSGACYKGWLSNIFHN
jgi:hypothetical protein